MLKVIWWSGFVWVVLSLSVEFVCSICENGVV